MIPEVYYEILKIVDDEYPDIEYPDEDSMPDFKNEFAFESLTELNTFYRKRVSNV